MKKQEFLSHSSDYLTEMFSSLLEKAYDAGYEQGKKEQAKVSKTTFVVGRMQWVNLELPSGKIYGTEIGIKKAPYNDKVLLPTKADIEELKKYCRFSLIVESSSTHTSWPSLYILDTHGNKLKLFGFPYNSNPDGCHCDIWLDDEKDEPTTSVLRLKILAIEEEDYIKGYDVETEYITNVFKGEDAINLMIKE